MLAHISIGIALTNIAVGLVFALTWLYFHEEIRHSSLLEEEFGAALRRLIGTIGLFAIPVAVYLLDGPKQSGYDPEPHAFVWGACYVVSLLILTAALATLIRDATRERKTGLYKIRR